MPELEMLADEMALGRVGPDEIVALTRAATDSTFYRDGLSEDQTAYIRQVVTISGPIAVAAAASERQRLVVAFLDGGFAGYVIATRHALDKRELDWLMVDPAQHGRGAAGRLMGAGLAWLGVDHPVWLTVIQHNERAIRFYRRFGFEIDGETDPQRIVPTWIMRRPGLPGTPMKPESPSFD